jgi:hypothetical protein
VIRLIRCTELNDPLNPILIRWLIVAARADLECIAPLVRDRLGRPRAPLARGTRYRFFGVRSHVLIPVR